MFQPHIIPHSFCFPVIEFPPVYAGVRSLFKKSHITAAKVEKRGVSTKKIIIFLTLVTSAPRTIFICRRLYLIEILHQTTTPALFKVLSSGCILSKFYIKPQLRVPTTANIMRCILSKFYIKPQRLPACAHPRAVVSYRNSTSNHNNRSSHNIGQLVVSYRNSTSNHNLWQMR